MSSFSRQLASLSSSIDALHAEAASPSDFLAALTTLHLITRNLTLHPSEPKYRSLNLSSRALHPRIGRFPAALAYLRAIGFTPTPPDPSSTLPDTEQRLRIEQVDPRLLDIALQLLGGSLEDAKRGVEGVVRGVAPTVGGEGGGAKVDVVDVTLDEEMKASEQESEDRKLSERLQREEDAKPFISRPSSSSSSARTPAATAEDGGDLLPPPPSPPPSSMETEADLRPDLHPSYNISDVKRLLTQLRADIASSLTPPTPSPPSSSSSPPESQWAVTEAYLSSLSLLSKITHNLLTHPSEPRFRHLSLINGTVAKRVGAYPSAVKLLEWIGFRREGGGGGEGEGMAMEGEGDRVRWERASSVMQRVMEESRPSEEEAEQRRLGPVDRELRVMDYNPAFLNTHLGKPEDVPSEAPDMRLLLSVASEDRRRNELLSRTDIFVTRNAQAEMKAKYRRRYSRTLLRVLFQPDNALITAYFRPFEPLSSLFAHLTPLLAPTAPSPFLLRLPPQTKLTLARDGARTFQALGLVPAATLYAGVEGEGVDGGVRVRWLREEVWAGRGVMEAVPVPVADNAQEIVEKKREEARMGGPVPPPQAQREGKEEEELDDEALEREMARRMAAAAKAKKRPAAAAVGSSLSSSSSSSAGAGSMPPRRSSPGQT